MSYIVIDSDISSKALESITSYTLAEIDERKVDVVLDVVGDLISIFEKNNAKQLANVVAMHNLKYNNGSGVNAQKMSKRDLVLILKALMCHFVDPSYIYCVYPDVLAGSNSGSRTNTSPRRSKDKKVVELSTLDDPDLYWIFSYKTMKTITSSGAKAPLQHSALIKPSDQRSTRSISAKISMAGLADAADTLCIPQDDDMQNAIKCQLYNRAMQDYNTFEVPPSKYCTYTICLYLGIKIGNRSQQHLLDAIAFKSKRSDTFDPEVLCCENDDRGYTARQYRAFMQQYSLPYTTRTTKMQMHTALVHHMSHITDYEETSTYLKEAITKTTQYSRKYPPVKASLDSLLHLKGESLLALLSASLTIIAPVRRNQ